MSYPHEAFDRARIRLAYMKSGAGFMQLAGIGWERVERADYKVDSASPGEPARAVLQLTLSGEGLIDGPHGIQRITQGTAMICQIPGTSTYRKHPDADHWEFLYVALRGRDAFAHWAALNEQAGHVICLQRDGRTLLEVSRLYAALRSSDPQPDEYDIAAVLYRIALDLHRSVARSAGTPARLPIPEPIEAAIRWIELNYGHELRPSELASRAGYTMEHFSRIFRKHTGLAPVEYIRKVRMEKAAELLTHTTLPITEIAERTGFRCANYFGKAFSATVGASPTEYRRTSEERQLLSIRHF